MNRFAFADFAVTNKPIPNVVRGSSVQITGFVVVTGRLFYEAALYDKEGAFQALIGPYPENAFAFKRSATDSAAAELLKLLLSVSKPKKIKPTKPAAVPSANKPKLAPARKARPDDDDEDEDAPEAPYPYRQ